MSTRVALVATLFVGCATLERPSGDWVEPVNIKIPAKALEDLVIEVICTQEDREGLSVLSHNNVCDGLKVIIESLGAEVVSSQTSGGVKEAVPGAQPEEAGTASAEGSSATKTKKYGPDFTVLWVEHEGYRDYCGATAVPFILSFSLFPCLEDISTSAEVKIVDKRGITRLKKDFAMNLKMVRGIPAFYYLAVKPMRAEAERKNEIAARFVLSVKNMLYSYVQADQLVRPDYSNEF